MAETLKRYRHFKARILPYGRKEIGKVYPPAHLHKGGPGFLFVCVGFIPYFHGKHFLVCRKIGFRRLNVSLQSSDALF